MALSAKQDKAIAALMTEPTIPAAAAKVGIGEPGGYWIDGQPVSQQEFRERLPRGPYVVDIGEGGDDAE